MLVQPLISKSSSQALISRRKRKALPLWSGRVDLTTLAMSCKDSECSLARRDLKRASNKTMVEWVAEKPFNSFITLTLDDKKSLPQDMLTGVYNMVGIQKFAKAIVPVITWLTSCPDDIFVYTAWCLERQKRGALHAHLISTCSPECAMWVKAIWQLGFSDVKPYVAAHSKYLVGYLNKDSHFDIETGFGRDGYKHVHGGLTPTREDWYHPGGATIR